jgi:DNA-binding NarL/FixJ family response regulator
MGKGKQLMIRVALAHPQSFFLDLIKPIINRQSNMLITGQSTCLHTILNSLTTTEVLLLSASFPSDKLMPFIKARSQQQPQLKILMLGMPTAIDQIMEFIEQGAFGYVLQEESTETMVKKIEAAHAQEPMLDSKIVTALLYRVQAVAGQMQFTPANNPNHGGKKLTQREIEVLQLIQKQLTNRQIANKLFIEEGTVKNHVHRILKKLNVSSRYEATAHLKWVNNLSPS